MKMLMFAVLVSAAIGTLTDTKKKEIIAFTPPTSAMVYSVVLY